MTAVALFGISGEPAAYIAAGPDGVSGGVENNSDEAVSLRKAREAGRPVQVESLTSETTLIHALPDGQFRAEIAAGMQRFRRGGDWIPVDLTLKAAADGSVAPVAHPNDLRISGRQGAGEHELAAIGTGTQRVAMGWSGALPAPVLDGNRATYLDARPGVDLVVEATRTGFEQLLVVKTREAATQVETVTFPFTGPGVASSSRAKDGSIAITDRAGKQTAHIPAPLMWDAKKNDLTGAPAVKRPVSTELGRRGDTVELTLAPDRAWLRDPATAYPVTIDPTVNPLGTTFDTYVRQTVTTDQNQEPDLQIGLLATTPATLTRSFLTWDTTVLAGKQINSATVSFWNYWSHTCTATSWEIWTTAPSTHTTTFANQPAWDTVGPDARSTATHGSTNCADAWATIDGKTFFQKAATANKTRAGMGVRATDETATAGFKQFRSREGANAAEDPKASVTYNSWPTVTARSTVPATSCVTGSGRPLVNTLTPQLRATVSDGDGTAMTVAFEWWALSGTTAIGSTAFTGVASGATASATVPAGAFIEGGSYKWRVKASDGVAGSDVWSPFCEMTVYETTAPPVTGCTGEAESDFNGDGVTDVAIADPEATVNGQEKAGLVHVSYGGAGTVKTLHEGAEQVGGAPGAGDGFGTSISAYDANNDGCTDLAVGIPYQDVSGLADAGAVHVLLGSPAGLAQGPASLVHHQDATNVPDAAEAGDWFGYSVAGSQTTAGEPYLVIGVPGEDIGTSEDTGLVHYLRGTTNVAMNQGAGIPGSPERDDRTGFSVAASTHHWAVGSPGEAIGSEAFAGAVNVFSHTLTNNLPTIAAGLTQDEPNVSDVARANDGFGKSVAIAPYRPARTVPWRADSLVVVGVPGEDITVAATNTTAPDAGMVQRFHVNSTNTFTELPAITFAPEDGDYLGEKVAVVNIAPASEGTNATMFIAAGVPGEDVGDKVDAGQVQVFPALANPVGAPVTIERDGSSLPGSMRAHEIVGTSLGVTSQRLLIGTPYGDDGVHAFTWSALAAGSTAPAQSWTPGVNGIPTGHRSFGAAIS
ncbi:DNRLRE domain-containing protein [Micromonospora sp. KC606]|uniref:DNRLRE domain-containing protein n=1 Tax=Micromonospora sp. KC606 TaxID=2530379 RepID=UPI001042F53D|nr:DNRLRE domain-containing protein [Micromonospora sp. KC606]TDC83483.1 DNRLRE domain-containing protein [Micromonospora sp. KC606]